MGIPITNDTFLYHSKLSVDKWKEFVYLTICNVSLPTIKETMGINIARKVDKGLCSIDSTEEK